MWVAGKFFKVWLFQSVWVGKKQEMAWCKGTLHLSSTLYCDSDFVGFHPEFVSWGSIWKHLMLVWRIYRYCQKLRRDVHNFRHFAAAFCYFGVELPTKSLVTLIKKLVVFERMWMVLLLILDDIGWSPYWIFMDFPAISNTQMGSRWYSSKLPGLPAYTDRKHDRKKPKRWRFGREIPGYFREI